MPSYYPHDFSDQQLKAAMWYTRHKVVIARSVLMTLFIVNLVIFAQLAVRWVQYVTGGVNARVYSEDLVRKYIPFAAFQAKNAPKGVVVRDRVTVSTGTETLDGFVVLENPNEQWKVESAVAEIQFSGRTFTIPFTDLYPREQRKLPFFNHIRSQGLGFVVSVRDVQWFRFRGDRPNMNTRFAISEQNFSRVGLNFSTSIAKFTLKNVSRIGYWEVPMVVVLYNQKNEVVGLNEVTLSSVRAESTRDVEVAWSHQLPSVARFTVEIPLSVFSPENHISLY